MAEVYFLLACYGLTFAICDASIFARPRAFVRSKLKFVDDLLNCYFCTGFWASLMLHLILFHEFTTEAMWTYGAWVIAHTFAGAAFCYALNSAIKMAEAVTERVELGSARAIQDLLDDDAS